MKVHHTMSNTTENPQALAKDLIIGQQDLFIQLRDCYLDFYSNLINLYLLSHDENARLLSLFEKNMTTHDGNFSKVYNQNVENYAAQKSSSAKAMMKSLMDIGTCMANSMYLTAEKSSNLIKSAQAIEAPKGRRVQHRTKAA